MAFQNVDTDYWVFTMAKTNAEKMKEWREKKKSKARQASQKYYDVHTKAVLERKKRRRTERKNAKEVTEEVGELDDVEISLCFSFVISYNHKAKMKS